MFGQCLSPPRDTGLLTLSPSQRACWEGEGLKIADTVVEDGVGIGRKSNLPDPLELIFPLLY